MIKKTNAILFNACHELYQTYLRQQEYYAALVSLAELYYRALEADETLKSKWLTFISNENISNEMLRAAQDGIQMDAKRIRHILSIGTTWNDDEIIFILGRRIDIEIVSSFLEERLSYLSTLLISDIDEEIEHISKSKLNEHNFRLALNSIKRNNFPPLISNWLKSNFVKF